MSLFREALEELPDAVFADVLESEEAYLLVFDLPGVTDDDVELSVEHGLLEIEASRDQQQPDGFEPVREERTTALSVGVPVPTDATADGAEASVERGVLEVTLPKHATASKTTIPVTE